MERARRGVALVAVSLLLFSSTLVAGAVTAPDRGIGGESYDTANASTNTSANVTGTLVGSHGGGPGWHGKGSVYLIRDGAIAWQEGSADSYFDVTRLPNGTVMAGFMHSGYETGCAPYDAPCTKTGFRIIDPHAAGGPTVLSEYAFPVRTGKNSETHDVERLEPGVFLLSDMEHERIFILEDGEITWQWNASRFYDAPPDATRHDWLHINDVDAISDTRYLVSVRNSNQLLVVERGEGVVEVVNADRGTDDEACRGGGKQLLDFDDDGEVRCGDPSVMDHQHNPQWLGPGAILVADSGNDRVVELHKRGDRWVPVWSLESAGGMDLNWPRDADRLDNGNTLVTDTLNKRVFEVTEDGTVVWSTGTPSNSPIPYEAERLPEGERAGATAYEPSGEGVQTVDNGIPGLSLALIGLRAVAPQTPFWFVEIHLAVSLVSLVGVVVGSADWFRQRR
ncbi:aryl-sulfate sulfotransferase [Halomicroarcula limicola]|uniref:Aryl-sulfate sulfotransferase n=1 Tax=Haloarcula limicola TaxID=1429915 RepID=A0A8J7YAP4_9EURY|nr:aryl-sulfate sulfotransferase [Halomicroarcula limicola]MBV0924379.1 aryl-sulfate sulfotransferase [Halomicroarcula limicola]